MLETNRVSLGNVKMGEKLTVKSGNMRQKILLEKRTTGHVMKL